MHWRIFIFLIFIKFIEPQHQNVKILFIIDPTQSYISSWMGIILKNLETTHDGQTKFDDQFINIQPDENEEQIDEFCNIIASGISVIIDLTAPDMFPVYINKIMSFDIPYIKLDITIGPFVEALDQYLERRNATDGALIFASETELDQAISYLIGRSTIRVIIIDATETESLQKLAQMRPSPSYYSIFATTENMRNIYNLAMQANLIYRYDRWNLIFFDYDYDKFINSIQLNKSMSIIYPKSEMACPLLFKQTPCDVPTNMNIFKEILNSFLHIFTNIVSHTDDNYDFDMKSYDCSIFNNDTITMDFTNNTKVIFYTQLMDELKNVKMFNFYEHLSLIQYKYEIGIKVSLDDNKLQELANWNMASGVVLKPDTTVVETKAFYRIGTAKSVPWSFPVIDPDTGQVMLNEDGTEKWTGYCVDLIDIISKEMNFDYELVIPKKGSFGKKIGPQKWDGLVGDLVTGTTDMAIAALTMTAEREEVIDYVAPYFEQTGILIVMRKPVRQTSMFKFMTVLKIEVWLSILGALVVTAILLWILDTYSPYSARNNKKAYPYPCREFTLKESFWFALTSFTPQGGGEAPKAISGRTLVAAYWLFVVLMLATFTANLAAFLTVERMQTPVQSLEQLARQSRINYTVVEGSMTHEYFTNMKKAEDTLYRLWKELTLNATSDQSQYRVWDYPIKEQYGHILSAIEETGTVVDTSEGISKVLERNDADFAFIHDSSEIKYEVSRNCNLTTIGDLFGQKPFALAVQQGSYLQEELSKVILDLQKSRVLEHLTNKYWNYSSRGLCSDSNDSEGISLESLGGVFIATLFGLALAMITLAGEVIYYKRKERNEIRAMLEDNIKPKPPKSPKLVTIGKTFKPVGDKLPRVSHISVFPRNTFHP